jgi:hypothetical protein
MTLHDAAMTRFAQWWLRCVRSGFAEAEISWRQLSSGTEYKALASAVFWAGVLPLFIIVASVFNPLAALAFLLYPLQVAKIAMRRGAERSESWNYATLMMTAKFAELQGALKYCWSRLQKQSAPTIEYKLSN